MRKRLLRELMVLASSVITHPATHHNVSAIAHVLTGHPLPGENLSDLDGVLRTRDGTEAAPLTTVRLYVIGRADRPVRRSIQCD
jgi:hypothetical protein